MRRPGAPPTDTTAKSPGCGAVTARPRSSGPACAPRARPARAGCGVPGPTVSVRRTRTGRATWSGRDPGRSASPVRLFKLSNAAVFHDAVAASGEDFVHVRAVFERDPDIDVPTMPVNIDLLAAVHFAAHGFR